MSGFIRPFFKVLLLACMSAAAVHAQAESTTTWQEFRKAYPYHIQVVAISGPQSDGRRKLIISEPPPDVTIERLRDVNPKAMQELAVFKQGIGYDGWVKDVVVSLPPMSPDELAALVNSLHRELFGTAYKAKAVLLPSEGAVKSNAHLDLRVPARELASWILGAQGKREGRTGVIEGEILFSCLLLWSLWTLVRRDRKWWRWLVGGLSVAMLYALAFGGNDASKRNRILSFSPVLGGETSTGREILEHRTSGVFFSNPPGVVVWAFPRHAAINPRKVEARQFALDSDIVIGAIASPDHVLLVGRERSLPVALLPPLRSETIVQLAAADTDELAQSYERKDIFAGKFDGAHDWAPIYLSQSLIDTEYGSLLNITDQMLKSWSMHGMVRYINFKYPDPSTFPFSTPLNEYAHTDEVTFNWNTKGAGYTAKNSAYEVFALNRTGALPVDYLSADNSELQNAEEKAYGYFAGLSDPNLVRVVQYAALYQIFRRFGVTAQSTPMVEPLHPPRSYREPLARIIESVASLSDDRVEAVALRLAAAGAGQREVDEIRSLPALRDDINSLTEENGAAAEQELIDAIAAPRLMQAKHSRGEWELTPHQKEVQEVAYNFARHQFVLQSLGRVDLNAIREAYASEVESRRTRSTWIRTPSIVLSWIEGEMGHSGTGGHNLDSRITLFREDQKLSAGEIRVVEENGNNVILHSPQDADKVSDLVRVAGRNEDKSAAEIEGILKSKLPEIKVVDREMPVALEFTQEVHPSAGRGYQETQELPGLGKTGWGLSERAVSEQQAQILLALSDRNAPTIVVSRQENGNYFIAHGASHKLVESSDLPSALDAVTNCIGVEEKGDAKVTVYLAGFEPPQGRGFAHSLEAILPEERAGKITAAIEGDPISPEELSRVLKEDYDLTKAKVLAVAESPGGKAVDVKLEVAAKSSAKPSLIVRMKIWLSEGVEATADLLQSVRNVIANWQLSFEVSSERLNLLFAKKALLNDLRKVHPGITSIDVDFSREGKDIIHAENLDPGELVGSV